MTLAIFIVIAAVIALTLILRISVSHSLQISDANKLSLQLQPIDVEAFRNLADPYEEEFLRHRLGAPEFRLVRRERLRAMAAYVQEAGRNAGVLIRIGQAALASDDLQSRDAAALLINDALLLRRNAIVALVRIYVLIAWPNYSVAAGHIADRYEQLSTSAMLLGRLQNPAVPVRLCTKMR